MKTPTPAESAAATRRAEIRRGTRTPDAVVIRRPDEYRSDTHNARGWSLQREFWAKFSSSKEATRG